MTKQKPVPERRQFIRIPSEDVFVCEYLDMSLINGFTTKRFHFFTKNLSVGGLLFESHECFSLGSVLKLQIDIPGWEKYKSEFKMPDRLFKKQPLIALSKVVRVEDIGGEIYEVGVSFIAVDVGHQQALRKYLSSISN